MIAKDLDGLLQTAGEIQAIPGRQVVHEVVDACDAVLDKDAVHFNIGVKVYTSTPVLDSGDEPRPQRCDSRVVVPVLLHVDGMPVLRVRDTKDEVNHLRRTLLRLDKRLGGLRVHGAEFGLGYAPTRVVLREDAGAVGEAVDDGRIELPKHESQRLFELVVYNHVLVGAKETMGQVGKGLDSEVDCVFPVRAIEVELSLGRFLFRGFRRGLGGR